MTSPVSLSLPVSLPLPLTPDVLVIGGGPAGLTAATRLALALGGRGEVLVLDREAEAGGVPRHCAHTGFGLRDLRRLFTGPVYARRLVAAAEDAGVVVRTRATVTGWSPDAGHVPDAAEGRNAVDVTSPAGRIRIEARAVILATGARERPRAARMIPGDRPDGVYTTGHLQQLVHLQPGRSGGRSGGVGRRAVVVGAEPVSWSAVLTLRQAGCTTALMTTTYPRADSSAAFTLPGRLGLGVPVATRTRVSRIIGHDRVEAVEIQHLDTGARRRFACDTVVLTGDWIPDHELARLGALTMDDGTRGPLVDTALRTSRPGVFAAGNLLHPVDTADVAALDGRHVADHVLAHLEGRRPTAPDRAATPDGVRLFAGAPLRWVAPGLLRPGDPLPPRGRLLAWTDSYVWAPRVRVVQDGGVRAELPVPWPAAPGRVFRVPASVLDTVDRTGGPVTLTLA